MWKHYVTAMLRNQEDGEGSTNGGGTAGSATNAGGEGSADGTGQEGQGKGQEGGDKNGQQGKEQEEKLYTQADIDRAVEQRLAREKKAADAAAEKAKREATMTAEQKAAEKEREAEQRIKDAETRAQMAEYRADLAGKVTRPDAALKLFDPEKHTTNGKADPAKFLKDNPEFAVKPADTSAGGAGGQHNRNTQEPDSWAAALAADRAAGRA